MIGGEKRTRTRTQTECSIRKMLDRFRERSLNELLVVQYQFYVRGVVGTFAQ